MTQAVLSGGQRLSHSEKCHINNSRDKDRRRRVHGSVGSESRLGVDGNDGGEETGDATRGRADGVTGTARRGREELGRVSVQNAVEGILEERRHRGKGVDLDLGPGGRQTEQEDACAEGEDGHGDLAS